jgi:A/G-specific adenine glycosylase
VKQTALAALRRHLLAWFRRHQRALPWRGSRDPYRIWLSEVMLQQTRVAAVLPYYRSFLRRFPNLRALARARTEEVLRLWSGLGYYTRARNLHRAAKEIATRHAGRFPQALKQALAMPGVGRYTAEEVLSIAHGEPHAVLDGNVARVLARLDVLRGDLRAPRRRKQLERRAQQLLDTRAPGEWNQALMELGATVCTPRAPRCACCPISRWCRAYQLDMAEQVPAARKRRPPVKLQIAAAVLVDPRGRTLMLRHEGELFSGMWQFPSVEVQPRCRGTSASVPRSPRPRGVPSRHRPAHALAQHLEQRLGIWKARLLPLPRAPHAVTFRQITLLPFLVHAASLPVPQRGIARTLLLTELDSLPVSSATRKIAHAALAQLEKCQR